ncbi:TolC family protein [Methylomicrobium sp. RS1]|uniref:TolC family protein n=1 Tax=Candidatus Methylomicrobium oryzae TaxID=2802053 RepID=UPI0019245CD6|nr:TolC family protein [Methylomicrobium sp. RS1]MBL1262414.1 TolC family protein [Methylomicrobium sp. RS1]
MPSHSKLACFLLPLAFCIVAAAAPNQAKEPDPGFPAESAALTLERAVNLAIERNPDLQIANERIGQAEAAIGESLAAFYPQIKARLSYRYSDNPAEAFGMIVAQRRFSFGQNINQPNGVTDFRPEVQATWSLYRGGRDYHQNQAAGLDKEIFELELSAVRNNLIHGVTDGFYTLVVAQENQAIAHRAIEAVQSELTETRKRHAAGTMLKADVLSLETRLGAAREVEIRAQNASEMARTVLRTLLDFPQSDPIEPLIDREHPVPRLPEAFDNLQAQAFGNRPEIQIAQRQIEARQLELKIALGENLPRVDAFVNYGLNERSPEFSSAHDNVTSGVAVEMDLFSGLGTAARVRKAERRLAEAKAQRHKIELQIGREVKNASLELQEALQRAEVARTAVAAAEEAFRLVTVQHRAGAATVTRFLETEVARDRAQTQWMAARYDALRAEAALQRALGAWR